MSSTVVPNISPNAGGGLYYSRGADNTSFYAFNASGGFQMNRGFDEIMLAEQEAVGTYDLTNAIQISFDVRTFNRKLGIFKDASNLSLVDDGDKVGDGSNVYFDVSSSVFRNTNTGLEVDTINLTAQELQSGLTDARQVMSVGAYSTMYSSFISYVHTYFGYAGGFSTLFQNAETFDIDGGGIFDGSSLLALLHASSDGSGAYTSAVSGSITMANVVEVLRYAVSTNCFNNRDSCSNELPSGISTDASNRSCYGVQDGFLAGDLVWIPAGTTVSLNVDIDSEAVGSVINNIGPATTASFIASLNNNVLLNYTQSGASFGNQTTATLTNISRTLTAPLVIRLDNLSNEVLQS